MKNAIKFIRFVKVFTLLVVITYLTTGDLHAQENPRWHISLSGGWALPVGSFSGIAPETGIADDEGSGEFNGFDKEGNSYARNGYAIGLRVQYRIKSNWYLTSMFGRSFNTVDSEVMREYLNRYANENWTYNPPIGGYRFQVDHQNYQVMYFLPGVAYTTNMGRWQFSVNPQLGIATMSYPEYSIIFLWIEDAAFQHRGETPSIQTLMWGSSVQLSYQLNKRFSAGLNVAYLSANFPYDISLIARGGALPLEKSDIFTYRQVQLGFQLGYRF